MDKIFLVLFCAMISTNVFAMTPADLIKVDAENNPQCVEYYHYKNQLYCSTTAQQTETVDAKVKTYEKQNIVFDERPWQIAWGQKNPTITTVEYVPMGDHIDSWNELITSQFIPNIQNKTSVKQYVNYVVQNLQKSGFHPIVKIFEENPKQIIFEFRIESPDNQKQDELQKVMQGSDGFYLLHYVIKQADMGIKNREKWLRNLRMSTIK